MIKILLPWLVVGSLYGVFLYWFDGPARPLDQTEIAHYLEKLEARGRDPQALANVRRFLETDDGREFFMVNLINLRETPLRVGDVQPDETSARTLARYSDEHMRAALLARASYILAAGAAAGANIEQYGLEYDQEWRRAGIVRYRSRRDLMEITTDPRFIDAHQYKVAAIGETFAFPIAPVTTMTSPRHTIAAILFALGALLQLGMVLWMRDAQTASGVPRTGSSGGILGR